MFCTQLQAKRFLKIKIKLPVPHANHKVNEMKLNEINKSRIDPETFINNYHKIYTPESLSEKASIVETLVKSTNTEITPLLEDLKQKFGDNLVPSTIPKNILISEEKFNATRLPQPFTKHSKNEIIEQMGNNAHFTDIGNTYIDFLKLKNPAFKAENTIENNVATAVLGYLYVFNYKAGKAEEFESKLINLASE